MPRSTQVSFNLPKLKRFEQAYKEALRDESRDSFVFEGQEYVKGYAKYLIQFLRSKLGDV